jgi:hypothetical protein
MAGYVRAKSFKSDILRGYLRNRPFVSIDLAGNANFRVYTRYLMVNTALHVLTTKLTTAQGSARSPLSQSSTRRSSILRLQPTHPSKSQNGILLDVLEKEFDETLCNRAIPDFASYRRNRPDFQSVLHLQLHRRERSQRRSHP